MSQSENDKAAAGAAVKDKYNPGMHLVKCSLSKGGSAVLLHTEWDPVELGILHAGLVSQAWELISWN